MSDTLTQGSTTYRFRAAMQIDGVLVTPDNLAGNPAPPILFRFYGPDGTEFGLGAVNITAVTSGGVATPGLFDFEINAPAQFDVLGIYTANWQWNPVAADPPVDEIQHFTVVPRDLDVRTISS